MRTNERELAAERVAYWDGELRKATTDERIDLCSQHLKEANAIYLALINQQQATAAVIAPFVTPTVTLNEPLPPYQHLTFQFHRSGETIRLKVARALRRIFENVIMQSYGGYINRLDTDDASRGLYEVHLVVRSFNIMEDPAFVPLSRFMRCTLEVPLASVFSAPAAETGIDPSFQERFVLDLHNESPPDWNENPGDNWETESIFSIESIKEPTCRLLI